RAKVTSLGFMGRSIGDVYAINTIGAILGSFAAGFVLLPLLGSSASSVLLGGIVLACAPLLLAATGAPPLATPFRLASLGAAALAAQTPRFHYGSYYGDVAVVEPVDGPAFMTPLGVEAKVAFSREDPTSSVTVLDIPGGNRVLLVDGIVTASD